MSPWTIWLETLARGLAEIAMPGLLGQASLEKYLLAGVGHIHAKLTAIMRPKDLSKALARGLAMPSALMRARLRDLVRGLAEVKEPAHQQALANYLCHVMSQARHRAATMRSPDGRVAPAAWNLNDPADLLDLLPLRRVIHQIGQELGGYRLKRFRYGSATAEAWKALSTEADGLPVSLYIVRQKTALEAFQASGDRLKRLSKIDHPGIQKLITSHAEEKQAFLAWTYKRSVPLPAVKELWEDTGGHINAKRVGRWIRRMTRALMVLHGQREPFAHGGLMPANVALALQGKGWKVHLSDVGWADREAEQQFRVRGLASIKVSRQMYERRGSWAPHYGSPTRLEGKEPTPADDVFALGMIWYQMVMGCWDLAPPRSFDWVDKALDRGLPVDHGKVMSRCLQPDASRRPADAVALMAMLDALVLSGGK